MTRGSFSIVLLSVLLFIAKDVESFFNFPECKYTLYTKTGDVAYAGTDSIIDFEFDVHVPISPFKIHTKIHDLKNYTLWAALGLNITYDYLERNQFDVFQFQGPCLQPFHGTICKANLTSDGTGNGAEWFVDFLVLTIDNHFGPDVQKVANVSRWLQNNTPSLTAQVDFCKK